MTNLRQPPQKNMSAKEKCIYPNLWWTSKNKMYAKKKYFVINFICLIHKACQILSTFTKWCQSPSSVSTFIFLTLTPNIPIIFSVLPQQTIISPNHCTGYAAHLKALHNHFWWDVFPCQYDPQWQKTFDFLVHELTWTHDVSQFSPQMVLVVLRIWNMCVLIFNLLIASGFIFESCS